MQHRGLAAAMTAPPGFITLVSGLPRSGTSLVMQMLEAGGMPVLVDSVRPSDVDNPRGYYEFEPVKRSESDASWLNGAEGRAVKVIYRLLPHLPADRSYRVILMRRDMSEVMASQWAMLERRGEVDRGEDESRLAEIFRVQLAGVEVWARRAEHVSLLCIDHGALIREPARVARRIASFLEPPLDVAAMAGCVDPSLYRQRGSG